MDYEIPLLEALQNKDFKRAVITILVGHPKKSFTSDEISSIISKVMKENNLSTTKKIKYAVRLFLGSLKKSVFSVYWDISNSKPPAYSIKELYSELTLEQACSAGNVKLSEANQDDFPAVIAQSSDIELKPKKVQPESEPENAVVEAQVQELEIPGANNTPFQQNVAEMVVNQLKNLPNITFTGPVTITINLK